jgi:succinate dehydrogenase assembly factor 2
MNGATMLTVLGRGWRAGVRGAELARSATAYSATHQPRCENFSLRRFSVQLTDEQLAKVETRDHELRERHNIIPPELGSSTKDRDEIRRKRVIYRSKQRGLLEVDLLMGSWASQYVNSLTEKELTDYEMFLNEETIDIFNYVTKKEELPAHLKDLEIVSRLQDYALKLGVTSPAKYADLKQSTNLT